MITDLEKAITDGRKYWLGPVVAVHRIGEYALLEYEHTDFHSGPNYGKRDGSTGFSGFINGHSLSRGWRSLDAALVGIVAVKRDGTNTQADHLFMKATQPEGHATTNAEVLKHWYTTVDSTEAK